MVALDRDGGTYIIGAALRGSIQRGFARSVSIAQNHFNCSPRRCSGPNQNGSKQTTIPETETFRWLFLSFQ